MIKTYTKELNLQTFHCIKFLNTYIHTHAHIETIDDNLTTTVANQIKKFQNIFSLPQAVPYPTTIWGYRCAAVSPPFIVGSMGEAPENIFDYFAF